MPEQYIANLPKIQSNVGADEDYNGDDNEEEEDYDEITSLAMSR